MRIVDFHTHSTASDGSFTPTELMKYAAEKGLDAIALTDHDTLSGLPEARAAAERTGVRLISGAEFSTTYENISLHIVGLFLPEDSPEILSKLEYMQKKRIERNKKMLENLQKEGVEITFEELRERFPDSSITSRAHIARIMKEKGYVGSNTEAFERYLGDRCKSYVKKESLNPEETIALIKNAGGVSVWAHPLHCKLSKENTAKTAAYLKNVGLDAIEAYYPTYTSADTRFMLGLAESIGLALSGGSDFHGSNEPKLELGTGYGDLRVPYEVLEKLEELRGEMICREEKTISS